MKFLFIFVDGVGLGTDHPEINPFASHSMPRLEEMLGGQRMIANGSVPANGSEPYLANTANGSLLALDACLGVDGLPQSASGQAALLTGVNIPEKLGHHEGPKPTPAIVDLISQSSVLTQIIKEGKTPAFANAYPPRYFESIESDHRLPGVISLAFQQAGVHLRTMHDLFEGNALSADFTAEGWRNRLGFPETPLLSLEQAGERLGNMAQQADLTVFEYWLTDIAGHHQDRQAALALLNTLDTVIGSAAESMDGKESLILLTSDHGNLEDLSTRHHTRNDVPLLLIGKSNLRKSFVKKLNERRGARQRLDLTDIAPAILSALR